MQRAGLAGCGKGFSVFKDRYFKVIWAGKATRALFQVNKLGQDAAGVGIEDAIWLCGGLLATGSGFKCLLFSCSFLGYDKK